MRVLLLPQFFTCPSGAGLLLDSGLVGVFFSGTVVKYTLKKTCLHFSARGRNKDAHPKGAKNFVHFPTSRR